MLLASAALREESKGCAACAFEYGIIALVIKHCGDDAYYDLACEAFAALDYIETGRLTASEIDTWTWELAHAARSVIKEREAFHAYQAKENAGKGA
jgi:hypothetical protein